jgi:Phage integrase, N-terminal SAM-like domain
MPPSPTAMLAFPRETLPIPSTVEALAAIPEEAVWLASRKRVETRRAYRHDVRHFLRTLGITSPDERRQVDRKAVVAWERHMREVERSHPATIRRRLAALWSLFPRAAVMRCGCRAYAAPARSWRFIPRRRNASGRI